MEAEQSAARAAEAASQRAIQAEQQRLAEQEAEHQRQEIAERIRQAQRARQWAHEGNTDSVRPGAGSGAEALACFRAHQHAQAAKISLQRMPELGRYGFAAVVEAMVQARASASITYLEHRYD